MTRAITAQDAGPAPRPARGASASDRPAPFPEREIDHEHDERDRAVVEVLEINNLEKVKQTVP